MNALWIDFVNSDWRDYRGSGRRQDRLEDPQWLRKFRREWGLDGIDPRRPEHHLSLSRLRSLLQGIVGSIVAGAPPRQRDLAALNRWLSARPVRSRLSSERGQFRLQLVPTARGLDAVCFAIAASFAEFLVEGDLSRLRTCDNADCGWVFYDRTKSRTRRWCGDACGNLIKVREFRERRKRKSKS
ncbi:MAG: CGNR zinc finger domain-containing protein [Phycisphaerales bacterium]|nr:MAG: CGNR zinc finger domain-containing protein [Phycisphaerales bacterium]